MTMLDAWAEALLLDEDQHRHLRELAGSTVDGAAPPMSRSPAATAGRRGRRTNVPCPVARTQSAMSASLRPNWPGPVTV
jgi:hypothetical protein